MRTSLFVSLLLLPVAFAPLAAAGEYCGEHICCSTPDPAGEPGDIGYFVIDTYGNAVLTACANADNADEIAGAAIDFVVDCVLGRSC